MSSGIYTITNTINNKIYVGYSISFRKRKNYHFHQLRKGTHYSSHMQRAYNRYGESAFIFEILEECPIELLASQEHYWATLLNVHNSNFGYNIRPTHPEGKRCMSIEALKRVSETNSIKISQFTKEGCLIRHWDSIKEAGIALNIHNGYISQCTRKLRYSSGGYLWARKGKLPIVKVKKQIIIKPKIENKRRSKSVYMINRYTDAVLNTFKSCRDAHKYMNSLIGAKLYGSNIRNAAREKRLAYGYKWKFEKK